MMRWTVKLMVPAMAAGLVMLGSGCDNGSGSPDVGDNDVNVVSCIGDSITEGGNPPWPTLVAERTGKTVHNRGHGGAKSNHGVGIVDGVLAGDKPGYLTIQFGANDVGVGRSRASIIENLRLMVQAAKANRTIPVVATITPMYYGHSIFGPEAREVNKLIRQMVSEEGAELADLESAFGDDPTLFEVDGLHPTQAGIEIEAQVFGSIVN